MQTAGPPPAEAAEQVPKQPSGSVQPLVPVARQVVCLGMSEDPETRAVKVARRANEVSLEYISSCEGLDGLGSVLDALHSFICPLGGY